MKFLIRIALATAALFASSHTASAVESYEADSVSVVYYIKDISPESIVKLYNAVERKATGRVGIMLSDENPHYPNAIGPDLSGALVEETGGRIADIRSSDGYVSLPIEGGYHQRAFKAGKNITDYDFMIVLSHFRGLYDTGYDGALKNIAMGTASAEAKAKILGHKEPDALMESIADACLAATSYWGDKVVYISVAAKISVDADNSRYTDEPQMADLGILASIDPVALDRACTDMVYNSSDPAAKHFADHIDAREGTHLLDATELLGAGTQQYFLITIE